MRHFNVGDENVRLVREHCFQRFFAVVRLRHHGNVALDIEQRGERAEYHPLVFGQNHADGLAAFFRAFARVFSA